MSRLYSLIIATIGLCGCAAGPVKDPFATESKLWPEPPEVKRIAYVGEFSRSSDLGIEQSAWSRLVSFTAGANPDAMVRPMAVAASADGRVIYVADPDSRCVHRYHLDKGRYSCLTIGREQMLISPIGLAASPDGSVYIADSQLAAIYQGNADQKYVQRFETSVDLEQPTGVAWDGSRQLLFVTDTGSQSIKVFDSSGDLVIEIGVRGHAPGNFNFPTYLWFDAENELLVTDSLNFRIQRFDRSGNFVNEFGENGDRAGYFARPKGLATDSFGHVYVIDALLNVMQVFSPQGDFLIAIGRQGAGLGEFWLPNGIFISEDNTIYVTDAYNKRVQVFRYVGPES